MQATQVKINKITDQTGIKGSPALYQVHVYTTIHDKHTHNPI